MKCDEILLLLPEYIEDRLSSEERQLVETHAAECTSCSAELKDLGRFLEVSAVDPENSMNPPDGFFDSVWPKLYDRVRTEEAAGTLSARKNLWNRLKDQFAQKPFQFAGLPTLAALLIFLLISYQSEKYQANEYSIAGRMSKMLSESLSETVIQGYSSSELSESVALNVLPDSSQINLSGILDSERRTQAYENFTDMLADFLIKTQNN